MSHLLFTKIFICFQTAYTENIHPSIQGRTEQIQIKTGELICRGGVITFVCIFSSLCQIGSDLLSQVYFGRLSSLFPVQEMGCCYTGQKLCRRSWAGWSDVQNTGLVQKGFTNANLLFMDLTFRRLHLSYLTSVDFVHLL